VIAMCKLSFQGTNSVMIEVHLPGSQLRPASPAVLGQGWRLRIVVVMWLWCEGRERLAGMSSVVRDECMAVHAFVYRSVQCKV
jgi:hypothetical protein